MAAFVLEDRAATEQSALALRLVLSQKHHVMMPVSAFAGLLAFRISAAIYNDMGDYEALIPICRCCCGSSYVGYRHFVWHSHDTPHDPECRTTDFRQTLARPVNHMDRLSMRSR